MPRLFWLFPLVFGAGCAACVEPPPDSDTPPVTTSSDALGVFVLLHWQQDRYYDESVELHGVLSADPAVTQVVDPIGSLNDDGWDIWLDYGSWPLPALGERVDTAETGPDLSEVATLDGGDRVLIGDDGVAYGESLDEGLGVYISDPQDAALEAFAAGDAVALEFSGGADIAAQVSTTQAQLPTPLVLDQDGDRMHVVNPTQDLEITWQPANDGSTVLVTVTGLDRAFVDHVEDTGAITFSAGEIADLGGDFLTVQVARMVESDVQLDEGVLTVRALDEAWLTFAQVESLGFFPTLGLTEERMVIEVFDVEGRFTTDSVLDLGDGVEVESLTVEDGSVLRAELYLTEDAETGPHTLSVDIGSEVLTANSSFLVYHPLPANDDCVSARTGPGLEHNGLYFRGVDGVSDTNDGTLDCDGLVEVWEGQDSWHRVTVPAQHELVVSGISLYGDIMLALYDACDVPVDDYLECWDIEGEYDIEFLDHTAGDEDETLYLLVDNFIDLDYDEVYLAIQVTPVADMIVRGDNGVLVGETGVVRVESSSHVWDGTATFDFGDDVTVDSVALIDTQSVDVTVSVDPTAVPGHRSITATQGADTLESGTVFEVIGQLPPSDLCATANALPTLDNAIWRGDTTGWTDDGWDVSSCWGAGESYADGVYRIELPSEGSDAYITAANGPDLGLILYRECGDTAVPVACVDNNGSGDVESLNFIAGAGEAGTYYLVVDVLEPYNDTFDLNIDID